MDAQELAAVFERHELPVTQDEVQALIRALDTDGNGNVDKHEFLEQMRVEQNRRRVLAKDLNKDLSKELKPAPPSRHRPASMDTVKSRRVRAMERVQEAEREREAVRAMEHRLHAEMLREAAHAKAAEEALRMKAAASAWSGCTRRTGACNFAGQVSWRRVNSGRKPLCAAVASISVYA